MTTRMKKAISQAKGSLKLLELARDQAKAFVNIPKAKEVSNEKLLAGLKMLGLATQDELNELKARVDALEAKTAPSEPASGSSSSAE